MDFRRSPQALLAKRTDYGIGKMRWQSKRFREESFMCGIVAYAGMREAEPVLVEGLRRLEYRGYDSAGLATLTGPGLHIRKTAGRIADLAELLAQQPAPGCHGIS